MGIIVLKTPVGKVNNWFYAHKMCYTALLFYPRKTKFVTIKLMIYLSMVQLSFMPIFICSFALYCRLEYCPRRRPCVSIMPTVKLTMLILMVMK